MPCARGGRKLRGVFQRSRCVTNKAIGLLSTGIVIGTVLGVAIAPALGVVRAEPSVAPGGAPPATRYHGRDMRLKTPRIPPVTADHFTPEQKAAALAVHSANGTNDNLRTALQNPDLGKQWWIWLNFMYDHDAVRAKTADGLPLIDK